MTKGAFRYYATHLGGVRNMLHLKKYFRKTVRMLHRGGFKKTKNVLRNMRMLAKS